MYFLDFFQLVRANELNIYIGGKSAPLRFSDEKRRGSDHQHQHVPLLQRFIRIQDRNRLGSLDTKHTQHLYGCGTPLHRCRRTQVVWVWRPPGQRRLHRNPNSSPLHTTMQTRTNSRRIIAALHSKDSNSPSSSQRLKRHIEDKWFLNSGDSHQEDWRLHCPEEPWLSKLWQTTFRYQINPWSFNDKWINSMSSRSILLPYVRFFWVERMFCLGRRWIPTRF